MGSVGTSNSTSRLSRPLSESWRDDIPENATRAQRNTLERLFKYGNTEYDYLKLEYTKFGMTDIDFSKEERERLGMKPHPVIQVSFILERSDREQSSYLNTLDSTYGSVLIGPKGGMYTFDGYGRKVFLSMRDATSRIAIQERDEKYSVQSQRKRNR